MHLSSILGDFALPFHAVYSGTKTFNRVFGRMIYTTKANNPPDTLIVSPSAVTTGMTEYLKDQTTVEPEQVVFGLFRSLGLRPYYETNGAFWHCFQGVSMKSTPHLLSHLTR